MTRTKKKKTIESFLSPNRSKLLDEASSLIKEFNKSENRDQDPQTIDRRIKRTYLVHEGLHDKLKILAAVNKIEISDLVNEALNQFLNNLNGNNK